MPNRYGDGTDGNDWWSANDPGQLHPYESGGITGNATPGPLQAAAPAGLPPLTGTPPYGNLRPDLPSRNGSPATAVGGPEQFGGDYQKCSWPPSGIARGIRKRSPT